MRNWWLGVVWVAVAAILLAVLSADSGGWLRPAGIVGALVLILVASALFAAGMARQHDE
jgi:hypothetical protein